MFAVIAAVLIGLYAFGVRAHGVNLFDLGLAFWAFHFAWDYLPPIVVKRQQQQP